MNLLICTNYIGQIKIKRVYTLAAIKWVSSGELMYRIMTKNNNVLYY
jgi:hypothetical protein